MDADRFERVVRVLTTASSRRQTLGGIVGALLGGVLGHGPLVATAKGKKGKKKKRGPVPPPPPPPPPSPPPVTCGTGTKLCAGQCIPTAACCGGCPAGSFCQTGTCLPCPIGLASCGTYCTDLVVDPQNCGFCGNACSPGDGCLEGACV